MLQGVAQLQVGRQPWPGSTQKIPQHSQSGKRDCKMSRNTKNYALVGGGPAPPENASTCKLRARLKEKNFQEKKKGTRW